jgi:cell division topological specificity factor
MNMNIQEGIAKILHYFQRPTQKSASVAKERLQIIIAHERHEKKRPDYLALMQKELLAVIAKYVAVNQEDIRIDLERKEGCSILELNITLPEEPSSS